MGVALKLKVAGALLVFIGGPLFVMWFIGHTTLKSGAKRLFVREHSCSANRVVIIQRDNLRYGDLVLSGGPSSDERPPADVAGDPERLEAWRAEHRAARKSSMNSYADYTLFEIHGCGHAAVLACRHPVVDDAEGHHTGYDEVQCEKVILPTPSSRK